MTASYLALSMFVLGVAASARPISEFQNYAGTEYHLNHGPPYSGISQFIGNPAIASHYVEVNIDDCEEDPCSYVAEALAVAQSSFGSVSVRVEAGGLPDGAGRNVASAGAYFADAVRILGTRGSVGRIEFAWSYVGTSGSLDEFETHQPGEFFIETDDLVQHIRFPVGGEFPFNEFISVQLFADIFTSAPPGGQEGIGPYEIEAGIESISVFDEAGVRLSGYHYQSRSGASYPFVDGQHLPEPSTWILMAVGLPALIIARRLLCR